jgi:hypothetical protein
VALLSKLEVLKFVKLMTFEPITLETSNMLGMPHSVFVIASGMTSASENK